MKKLHNILAVTAIALTFTACSSDNDNPANNDGKEYPISLSVGIGDLSVVTRAGSTTIGSSENTPTTLTSGSLGLFITRNGDKSVIGKYLCNNSNFVYSSGWNCTTTYYWASDNATIDYIAYYPYQENSNVIDTYYKTITWDVTNQAATATGAQFPALDLLYQKNDNVSNNLTGDDAHKIAILLGHVCSKLTVKVSKLGSEIASGTTISDIKINNIDATGKFDLNAGTWSDNTDCVNNIAMNKWTTAADGAKYTFDAILIPQTAAASLSITLSTGAVYQLAIPEQAYAMGKNYTITIQVGQDKVELGNITQTDWVSVTGGDLTAQ